MKLLHLFLLFPSLTWANSTETISQLLSQQPFLEERQIEAIPYTECKIRKNFSSSGKEIVSHLVSSGFKCEEKSVSDCRYTECNGEASFYPGPLYFAIPSNFSEVRLHFHGHILNTNTSRRFEGSPSQMMAGFNLQKNLCESQEAVVIPASVGRNETYKNTFTSATAWEQFTSGIGGLLKLKEPLFHLSGHSGGGKYVALALAQNVPSQKVSLYDGFYAPETLETIDQFIQKKGGQVFLSAVAQGSPDNYVMGLVKKLQLKGQNKTIKGISYTHYSGPDFSYYRRTQGADLAHFLVLTETWSLGE
jgi:hypothetical protein